MLRAVSIVFSESQALEIFKLTRRDVFKVFRAAAYSNAAPSSQTVLSEKAAAQSPPPPQPPPPPPPPSSPPPRRAWPLGVALALTASIGGVYYYRKLADEGKERTVSIPAPQSAKEDVEPPIPALGSAFPEKVQFLLVGGGTAAFAAMRAIRAARPDAAVLMVGEERALPYMRPPLSKELWREPDLATRAASPDELTFRQWNGKRRSLVYEPPAFYTPVEKLAQSEAGGASVARGWKVTRVDVQKHEAELVAPGQQPVVIKYDKCLISTGVRSRRVAALGAAARAGRSLALRGVRDAAGLARALQPAPARVAVLGGGFLATELSAALAARLRDSGTEVVQVVSESAPMGGVLPLYLAQDLARRLGGAGVTLITGAEVCQATVQNDRVHMRLCPSPESNPESVPHDLEADLVVECVGSELDNSLADASGLETHPELGGLLVNAELQARTDVYAAGDAACFYDVVLGRRRVEHHDHAVVSGRLAGENMAGAAPAKHYTHQSMFWSDLGPQLGYEAIGIIDSRLPTVGIFSADAVNETPGALRAADFIDESQKAEAAPKTPEEIANTAEAATKAEAIATQAEVERDATTKEYNRGVVFYLRGSRVVGVLLWNLFNRMHVARQVVAQGEFEDLFEVAKLFAPHEQD